MEITEKLESKKTVKHYRHLRKDLKEQTEKGLLYQVFSKPQLKKEVAELGLLIVGKTNYFEDLSLGSERMEKIKKYIKPNMWDDKDYDQLLVYFFGHHADLVKHALTRMPIKCIRQVTTDVLSALPTMKIISFSTRLI